MANEDGTVWTVFNGEIYNHHDLRRDLERRGHVFRGHSDTEVLPHLYEEYGPDFLTRLRGMFALAILNTRTMSLVLARDRFGIKPLFYAPSVGRMAFASEIRALLPLPGVDRQPDRQAVYDFAALFYIPAPQTFYTGIRALLPGELLEARLDGHEIYWKKRYYHRWSIAIDNDLTLDEAADRTEQLLTTAVGRQMESEVPIGGFLSGGIDSSLVSSGAQASLGGALRTFNVRFSDEAYDETWAAVAVARHIGSNHTVLDMDDIQGTWSQIIDLLLHAGQPFADTSLFATSAICRMMRNHVTVAVSGDGGDEAFGGYNTYWQLDRILRMQYLPRYCSYGAAITLSAFAAVGLAPDHLASRVHDFTGADDVAIVHLLSCWIREKELGRLCIDYDKVLPIRRLFEPQWDYQLGKRASRLERVSAYATEAGVRLNLPNDYLFKVDTASMKHSLEVRVPMLDEDLFSFGLSLPHRLKVQGKICKQVLRTVAERRLPPAVAHKQKAGFSIPIDSWVEAGFRDRLRESLLGTASLLPNFFHPEAYGPVVEAFCERRRCPGISRQGLYQRVIMLLSLQLALESRPV